MSHSIYVKDVLQVAYMNKRLGGQQLFLWPGWYMAHNGEVVSQKISTVIVNPSTGQSYVVQKEIQAVLVKRGLWP